MKVANPYKVETIETCRAPRDIAEGDWCRYVVANSQSRIVGRYRGSLSQTRRKAQTLADGLNSRLRNGGSPWAPRGRKAASKTTTAASKTH
jgi:hypothetical protein